MRELFIEVCECKTEVEKGTYHRPLSSFALIRSIDHKAAISGKMAASLGGEPLSVAKMSEEGHKEGIFSQFIMDERLTAGDKIKVTLEKVNI